MIWLELRTHHNTYASGWNFTESVWAPTHKENGSKWPFWGLVNNIVKGDLIFHLRYVDGDKRFLGYSTALSDGYMTNELPTTSSHDWDFSQTFYKADLSNFEELIPSIRLEDYFSVHESELREYYRRNSQNLKNKRRLFYTIQNNRLQCLFGAYFSEFENNLVGLLLKDFKATLEIPEIYPTTNTAVILAEVERRIGQQEFSDNVKSNYGHKCCFPGCPVEGKGFLIGGHIARWADNKFLRGHTGNGLCLCLMHDKAFEKGFFTLDSNNKIIVVRKHIEDNIWLNELLLKGDGLEIKERAINPLPEALKMHWERIGYK